MAELEREILKDFVKFFVLPDRQLQPLLFRLTETKEKAPRKLRGAKGIFRTELETYPSTMAS